MAEETQTHGPQGPGRGAGVVAPPEEAAATTEPKLDAQGRAYATGKRKNAVARVWIKPGAGRSRSTAATSRSTFARPVLRMILNQPFEAADRGPVRRHLHGPGGGLSGQAGAVRHGISQALLDYEPGLRPGAQEGRLPDPRLPRGGAQEVRQGQGPPQLPVLQAII